LFRDVVGDCNVVGDSRWAGAWGIDADFSARTACSLMSIRSSDILVSWVIRKFVFVEIYWTKKSSSVMKFIGLKNQAQLYRMVV
jgi:hypothetical protein